MNEATFYVVVIMIINGAGVRCFWSIVTNLLLGRFVMLVDTDRCTKWASPSFIFLVN